MSSPLNKYGDLNPRTGGFAVGVLLERGQFSMVTERFGQRHVHPRNKTKTRKYRRYLSLARATAPLAEGITPAGSRLSHVDVEVTLEWLGDWVPLTDVILDTHEDPILKETMELLGEQAAETIEVYRINVLKSGSNVCYANAATSRSAVNSPPTRGDLRRVYRSFRKKKARMINRIIAASSGISTEPIEAGYWCMCSTDLDADLRGITGFVPKAKYANSGAALDDEIGSIEQFRFVCTPLFEPWEAAGTAGTTYLSGGDTVSSATACDVYPLIFVARDAYAIVPLQGRESITPMVYNPKAAIGDELAQNGFASWKSPQGCVILNNDWLVRLEAAVTANPA